VGKAPTGEAPTKLVRGKPVELKVEDYAKSTHVFAFSEWASDYVFRVLTAAASEVSPSSKSPPNKKEKKDVDKAEALRIGAALSNITVPPPPLTSTNESDPYTESGKSVCPIPFGSRWAGGSGLRPKCTARQGS